ncbi:MAG: DUF86 domain-containing protein [Chloroflexales bacterium]|nr:DUF86 domain-containing protein [Chloroflexales bacterium]
MRDKLIHNYFGVDLDQVWLTATIDAPILKSAVIMILTTLQAGRENPSADVQ